jgi:hypothetical protein
MGSAGVGSSQHLAGELFKMMTNVNLVHVPYRGGAPAITDLLGGQVQVTLPESIEYIRTGKLRPLAAGRGEETGFKSNKETSQDRNTRRTAQNQPKTGRLNLQTPRTQQLPPTDACRQRS